MTSTYDGKDVKSNLTSGPKGKSYYIELYKSLEARLSEVGDASARTGHLCEAWRRVHSLCQHSAPSTHLHLLSWLQRHTARTVLQTGWQSPKRKDDRKGLEDAINDYIAQCSEAQAARCGEPPPWESQLAARGDWFKRILDQPWDHPVLTRLLNPNGTPPTDDDILKWLREERGVTFVMRLHTLVAEKCEDLACSLAAAVMDRVRASAASAGDDDDGRDKDEALCSSAFGDKLREEAGFTIDVWEMLMDIEFVLQHKRDSQMCIALAKKTPLRGAYQLIERLQSRLETSPREKRLWKNAKEVAILIAQVVIARCMVIPSCSGAGRSALYCCARSLAAHAPARLLAAGAALAAPAPTARHLHTFAAAVRAHLPPSNEQLMKPFVCELYVRAITAGMNELEKLKLKTEKEADSQARLASQTLAAWVVQLGGVLASSKRVLAECHLTAFSLYPSQHMYDCLGNFTPPAVPKQESEPKEEATTSEFGSWANDSRSQTNFVKTSETLNMKHTQNQANVLSTAILNEGEAMGLSPELCQDIAVVLSGPRIKTLSWDMDREELLEKCRSYMERTRGGTLALTTELKYLNLDPANFQHLPEDRDEDEDDIYYGIEKGYEHLVQFEEPDDWDDINDPSKTDTATSCQDDDIVIPGRKKKNKSLPLSSDEDSNPLSIVAEAKRHQKKKERPHSKERSQCKEKKERKKKQEVVDPLGPEDEKVTKTKEKKERKKKDKVPKVQSDKPLSELVGLKVARRRKKKIKDLVTGLDFYSQDNLPQEFTNSVDNNKVDDSIYSMGDIQRPHSSNNGLAKSSHSPGIGNRSQLPKQVANNLTAPHKPWLPNPIQRQPVNKNVSPGIKAFPNDVRASISKLLEFRRKKAQGLDVYKQPKLNAHMIQRKPVNAIPPGPEAPNQTNISPKAVAIPEIPKSYINKEQSEKLADLKREVDTILSQRKQRNEIETLHPTHRPVIQYAKKQIAKPPVTDSVNSSMGCQQTNTNALKMSDLINVSTDRVALEKMIRGNSYNNYDMARTSHAKNPQTHHDSSRERAHKSAMSGQNDYLQFLKDYQAMKNNTIITDHYEALDMSTKTLLRDTKKDIRPTNRVVPVVPRVPKSEPKVYQSAKASMMQQKKPEASLNTFSRLSYMHKNKQTEMKNKNTTEVPVFSFSTYQEVSSELDEIIKKHKLAQMKVIQSKNEILGRTKESHSIPAKSNIEATRRHFPVGFHAREHPLLSNLLEQNDITVGSSNLHQIENSHKNAPVEQNVSSTPMTSLTHSDQNEINNLLRQKNKLNSAFYQSSTYSSTSNIGVTNSIPQAPIYNSTSCTKQQPIIIPTPNPGNKCQTRDKVIKIISSSVIKPADKVNSGNLVGARTTHSIDAKINYKGYQDKIRNEANNIQTKKLSVVTPHAKKNADWESVMNAILKHKTPSRGPNALDVALNKSSLDEVFGKSVKTPSVSRQSTNKDSNLSKPTKITNAHYTNNEEAVMKLQMSIQERGVDIKKCSDSTTSQKPVKANSSETCKKLSQEVQRKQFTYAGPKEDDPFISGIPNSDYDLLEELMDDDLRKEIGELLSDEESFNTAAQSFLKSPNNEVKRVSVEFNTPATEISAKKSATGSSLHDNVASDDHKVVKKCNYSEPIRKSQGVIAANPSAKMQGTIVKPSTTQIISANIPTVPNYSSVLTSSQLNPNIYITPVPQPVPIQNVVIIGSDLVYNGYPTVQTPSSNLNNMTPNSYLAVNNAPNVTLYQTSGYSAPIVNPVLMGNSITVPVVNNVPCTSAAVNTNNSPKPDYHVADSSSQVISRKNRDKCEAVISNSSKLNPESQVKTVNEKPQEGFGKNCERKVLSEVRDNLTGIENVEKTRTTEFERNIKKGICDNKERLKQKRMAIINREIYHRCGSTPIPLSYSPLLTPKIVSHEQEITNIPDNITMQNTLAQSTKNKEEAENTTKEGIMLKTEIKNQVIDEIGEINSPITPENENCKENKNSSKFPYRRILLRSSNKIKSKTDSVNIVSEKPNNKKSTVKLKLVIRQNKKKVNNCKGRKKDRIDRSNRVIIPMRSSKRLRNKSLQSTIGDKIKLKHPEQSNLVIENKEDSSVKVNLARTDNKLVLPDVETEIPGSIIPIKMHKSQRSKITECTVSKPDKSVVPSLSGGPLFLNEKDDKILDFTSTKNEILKEAEDYNNALMESKNPAHESSDSQYTEDSEQERKIDSNKMVNIASSMPIQYGSDYEPHEKITNGEELKHFSTDIGISANNESVTTQLKNHLVEMLDEKVIKSAEETEESSIDACVLPSPEVDVSNEVIANNLPINDVNIDLDMTVTCEEAPYKILDMLDIKYCKIIEGHVTQNSFNKLHCRTSEDKNQTTQEDENRNKNEETHVLIPLDVNNEHSKLENDSNNIQQTKNNQYSKENYAMQPNSSLDAADDIQIIDEDANPLFQHDKCDGTANKTKLYSDQDKIVSQTINENKNTPDIVLSNSQDSNDIKDFSEISQSYKDSIIIEQLPNILSDDPLKKCVRVKLPNGRTFKATVYGQMHVNFDTLFTNPAIKSTLLNNLHSKKRYTMNIKQVTKIAKCDPNKILSTKLSEIKPTDPVETIDLLSDDDIETPNLPRQSLEVTKQNIETEFGTFQIVPIDNEILAKHQLKLKQRIEVKLQNIQKSVTNLVPKSIYKNTGKSSVDVRCYEKFDHGAGNYKVPHTLISEMIKDIDILDNNITSSLNNATDVVEIDDSSNDCVDADSYKNELSKNKICELKDVLLQELGVCKGVQSTANKYQRIENKPITEEIITIDDELPNETLKNTASDICPYNPLKNNNILISNCFVKLVRCDDLLRKMCKSNEKTIETVNRVDSLPDVIMSSKTLIMADRLSDLSSNQGTDIMKDFNLVSDLDTNAVESDSERSSSPVIQFFDVIASLESLYTKQSETVVVHESYSLTCVADWLITKRMLVSSTRPCIENAKDQISELQSFPEISISTMLCTHVPTLLSQVLKVLQNTNVICKMKPIGAIQNQSGTRLLKRKSIPLDLINMPKVLKLDTVITEPQSPFISYNATLDSTTTESNNSVSVIEENSNREELEKSLNVKCLDKTENSILSPLTTLDDNHNMNEKNNDFEQNDILAMTQEHFKSSYDYKDISSKTLSDTISESAIRGTEDTFNESPPTCVSPVIEIGHLIMDDNMPILSENSECEEVNQGVAGNDLEFDTVSSQLPQSAGICDSNRTLACDLNDNNELIDDNIQEDTEISLTQHHPTDTEDLSGCNVRDIVVNDLRETNKETALPENDSTVQSDAMTMYIPGEKANKGTSVILGLNESCLPGYSRKETNNVERSEESQYLEDGIHVLLKCESTEKFTVQIQTLFSDSKDNVKVRKKNELSDSVLSIKYLNTVNTHTDCILPATADTLTTDKDQQSDLKESNILESPVKPEISITNNKFTPDLIEKNDVQLKDSSGFTEKVDEIEEDITETSCVTDGVQYGSETSNVDKDVSNLMDKSKKPERDYKLVEHTENTMEENEVPTKPTEMIEKISLLTNDCEINALDPLHGKEMPINVTNQGHCKYNHEISNKSNLSNREETCFGENNIKIDNLCIQKDCESLLSTDMNNDKTLNLVNCQITPSCNGMILTDLEETAALLQDNLRTEEVTSSNKIDGGVNVTAVNEGLISDINHDSSLINIENLEESVAIWDVSVRNIDNEEEISFCSNDTSSKSIITKYLSMISKDQENVIHTVNEIKYEDPEAGTCYIFPIIEKSSEANADLKEKVQVMVNTIIQGLNVEDSVKQIEENEIESDSRLHLILPKRTYSKYSQNNYNKTTKRKINMTDIQFHEKKKKYGSLRKSKYKYDKNIDYPKFSISSVSDTTYTKEFKSMFDYCSSISFSYSIPFHKEHIDVDKILKSWPIRGKCAIVDGPIESKLLLFTDTEESLQTNPMEQSFAEEIISESEEKHNKTIKIEESNFSMGFGDGSGRVKIEQRDGEYTAFSAATLSDVKQIQPLLPSEEQPSIYRQSEGNEKEDHVFKMKRFYDNLNLKEKVRSFFEKSKVELTENSLNCAKDNVNNNVFGGWPFCLTSPEYACPPPIEITVNVVQVGQLPVSTSAQNPVSCDPRVTHVSNVSPSQCSPENSNGIQSSIKTEYTELTTADMTLPLMQEYTNEQNPVTNAIKESTDMQNSGDNIPMATEIKSVVKIELMEETSQDQMEENMRYETQRLQLSDNNLNNGGQYHYNNMTSNVVNDIDMNSLPVTSCAGETKTIEMFTKNKQMNDIEKTNQINNAMNAAGITALQDAVKTNNAEALVDIITQNAQSGIVSSQKSTPITTMALQQALAQILPPPLNQSSENNPKISANPQVLHIVQGNNSPSVINKPNGTQLLHIVQNKNAAANGTPTSQSNSFGGLSLVDGTAIQQNGNLLHIVNSGNQKTSNNGGQLLKRVNLLTNIANVQGSNDKLVHVLCKSADGKSIQLPTQRSMVLRLQPLDPPSLQTPVKPNETQDTNLSSSTSHVANPINGKDTSSQEIKSRSLYEENYAKFVQNGEPKSSNQEKSTCLPKFNQVFGKQVYQDKQDEIANDNVAENTECASDDNIQLGHITDIGNPPMLIRKPQSTPPAQPNLVQQIKQTIGPMNVPMHGGVIYTRQIPVNIGNGQTINLITVPSNEISDDATQKLQNDGKFHGQEGDAPIIKIVPTNPPTTGNNNVGSEDNIAQIGSTNEAKPQQNPQPVLTQMRIKLPMLSKVPQMVGGARVVRPSFFQIQRNVIGGANQQVYQQLVLTAAPQLGQTIRLPAQTQKPKAPPETQSSPESQMSSSTLEQLREFDMVLEQVKERSTVQPGSSTSGNNFSKLNTSADTTDAATPGTSTLKQDPPTPTQVMYSVGSTQSINIASFVNRKSTITSTPTSVSSYVRSPDSTGVAESPSSSTTVHLPHTTVTSDSCASTSCASDAATASTSAPPKPKKKSKPKSSTSTSNPFKINSTPPKTSSQKPLEDEQTTQRILYILAEYKEQVENSPDKDKPAPRRRNNPAAPNAGTSKRKKSSSGSRKRDSSPIGEDSCRTMGSEDSSCGASLGECNECSEGHSPEESPRKVVRRLTFEQETPAATPTRTTTIPQRNVIVADGQAFAVRNATGKPATTVLMPANYLLPVSMVKGGQQIAIVTNRGPKLLVGAGDGGTGGTLLFQRLIGPAGLKPVLTRPGVRHIRLPTAALHNLQTFNIATPATTVIAPDSTASPAPAPAPPDLIDTRAMSSPWPDRTSDGDPKPDKGSSSPDGSEPWNLPSSSIADDYGYEEIVRTDNMDRTVLDAIPDRYSPDMEAQRIFDKMFDVDSKKSMYDSRCPYDIDASDDDKSYHQVVQRKDGRHHRLTHVSAAALRHKYAIIEHELRLQKSLSEECEDLGVDSPSASELFPEAELLFAPSPAHEQTIDQCHTPPSFSQGIPQPDLDDQTASDRLLAEDERRDDLELGLDDVGEMVTVGADGTTTLHLDHEAFARSHPNTTFHSEPEDGEIPPFTITHGLKGRPITFARGVPGTVVMAPQTTVISQATVEAAGTQNTVKFTDIDNIINAMPSPQHAQNIMPSVLVKDDGLHKFDSILNDTREVHLANPSIVHTTGNGTQVIRRVACESRDRYSLDDDLRRDDKLIDDRRDGSTSGDSGTERQSDLFWEARADRFEDKCCKYDDSPDAIGNHTRMDSVIKAARSERRRSDSPLGDAQPPLRTYPARRPHSSSHSSHASHTAHSSDERSSRARERCHDEGKRRASNRGVVKRGCHCCNGSTAPPKPKKSKKRPGDYHTHN